VTAWKRILKLEDHASHAVMLTARFLCSRSNRCADLPSVEVFRVPHGSCLVRIDGDPNRLREWFLYCDEIVISDA
jgi:hypothetical protein